MVRIVYDGGMRLSFSLCSTRHFADCWCARNEQTNGWFISDCCIVSLFQQFGRENVRWVLKKGLGKKLVALLSNIETLSKKRVWCGRENKKLRSQCLCKNSKVYSLHKSSQIFFKLNLLHNDFNVMRILIVIIRRSVFVINNIKVVNNRDFLWEL